jgi:transposase-like protein
MNTSDIKLPSPGKRRGRYSNEFKHVLIEAYNAPGGWTAEIALANCISANLWHIRTVTASSLAGLLPRRSASRWCSSRSIEGPDCSKNA